MSWLHGLYLLAYAPAIVAGLAWNQLAFENRIRTHLARLRCLEQLYVEDLGDADLSLDWRPNVSEAVYWLETPFAKWEPGRL